MFNKECLFRTDEHTNPINIVTYGWYLKKRIYPTGVLASVKKVSCCTVLMEMNELLQGYSRQDTFVHIIDFHLLFVSFPPGKDTNFYGNFIALGLLLIFKLLAIR